MVTVVVDDQDAVRLAADLESALGAAEIAQAVGDPFERQPEFEADRDGRQRVLQVVTPRHVQRQPAERLAASAIALRSLTRVTLERRRARSSRARRPAALGESRP